MTLPHELLLAGAAGFAAGFGIWLSGKTFNKLADWWSAPKPKRAKR